MNYKSIDYGDIDAIIFDIDGVLVNVDDSYNQTIEKTIQYILKTNFNIQEKLDFPIKRLVSRFRHTGGFNNDIDTTYSIILITIFCRLITKMDSSKVFGFFEELLKRIDDRGIISIERELEKLGNIEEIKSQLDYPNHDSIITTVFNEILYGPDLFKKQFKRNPKYYFDIPLLKNDVILIKEETIIKIREQFDGKMVLISGRSKIASDFTLNKIIQHFIKDACIFLEDEKREYSKPNSYALHKVFNQLKIKKAVYVGDSIEDLLMVKKFESETNDKKIIFFGIYGKGESLEESEELKELFKRKGADLLIENVNDIPNILNNTKKII
ncbi:MAG: HAD-IA family hydrolase [Thermoproteota archaeon]|nr:HAD-IA family hydrolase [Thermoproteota archaeon]